MSNFAKAWKYLISTIYRSKEEIEIFQLPGSPFPKVIDKLIVEYVYETEASLLALIQSHSLGEHTEHTPWKFIEIKETNLSILQTEEHGWWLLEFRNNQERIVAEGKTLVELFSHGKRGKSSALDILKKRLLSSEEEMTFAPFKM